MHMKAVCVISHENQVVVFDTPTGEIRLLEVDAGKFPPWMALGRQLTELLGTLESALYPRMEIGFVFQEADNYAHSFRLEITDEELTHMASIVKSYKAPDPSFLALPTLQTRCLKHFFEEEAHV